MRFFSPIIFFLFTALSLLGQSKGNDTLKTTVNLKSFKLSKKVVRAEYGQVIMFFNQTDYLKAKVAADTVQITPKYFSDEVIADLLKKGRVKIIKRSDNTVETKIVHYLRQYGSFCDRVFELQNEIGFFSILEIIGIYSPPMIYKDDSISDVEKEKTFVQVNDFGYPEEFPKINDTMIIKIKDYFPLKEFIHYVYNPNNGYGELDTSICKSAKLADQNIFYFEDCYKKYITPGFSIDGLCYFYKNDSLFALEIIIAEDIAEININDALLLFPANMIIGDSVVMDLGMSKQTITLLAKEDLQINDTVIKDCLKFKTKDYWSDEIYIRYVWLQKDVGIVKEGGKELINHN